MAALTAGITVGIVGCGRDPSPMEASEEKCLILVNGNKLCGRDAITYCRGFIGDGSPSRDAAACRQVGVDIPKTAEERQRAEDEASEKDLQERRAFSGPLGEPVARAFGRGADDAAIRIGSQPGGGVLVLFDGRMTEARAMRICEAVRKVSPTLSYVRVGNDDGKELEFEPGCADGVRP